ETRPWLVTPATPRRAPTLALPSPSRAAVAVRPAPSATLDISCESLLPVPSVPCEKLTKSILSVQVICAQFLTVTVTSNGYYGSGWMPIYGPTQPNNGQKTTSNTAPYPVSFTEVGWGKTGCCTLEFTYTWDSSVGAHWKT